MPLSAPYRPRCLPACCCSTRPPYPAPAGHTGLLPSLSLLECPRPSLSHVQGRPPHTPCGQICTATCASSSRIQRFKEPAAADAALLTEEMTNPLSNLPTCHLFGCDVTLPQTPRQYWARSTSTGKCTGPLPGQYPPGGHSFVRSFVLFLLVHLLVLLLILLPLPVVRALVLALLVLLFPLIHVVFLVVVLLLLH